MEHAPDVFYPRLYDAMNRAAGERRACLVDLHAAVHNDYCAALLAIDDRRAAQPASDGRTLAQVVGHIMEWDRYIILGAGELLAGLRWPQMMQYTGFLDVDGSTHSFSGIDDFNARQAEKHATLPWAQIRAQALDAADALYALFADPGVMSPARLARGNPCPWRLPGQPRLEMPVGWVLWGITLEHAGAEHAVDLYPYGSGGVG